MFPYIYSMKLFQAIKLADFLLGQEFEQVSSDVKGRQRQSAAGDFSSIKTLKLHTQFVLSIIL